MEIAGQERGAGEHDACFDLVGFMERGACRYRWGLLTGGCVFGVRGCFCCCGGISAGEGAKTGFTDALVCDWSVWSIVSGHSVVIFGATVTYLVGRVVAGFHYIHESSHPVVIGALILLCSWEHFEAQEIVDPCM